MSRILLIERLERLSSCHLRLAAEIHDCWSRYRLAEGWTLGPADQSRKSSPYLKPLQYFEGWELEREMRLALNDLRGIVKTIDDWNNADDFCGATSSEAMAACLTKLRDNARFVESASSLIHDGWREANRLLSMNVGDARLLLRFDELPDSDKSITLANVRSDIEALARLTASTAT